MIIERYRSEYQQCRIPGLAATSSGNLIACYECRLADSDWAEIDLKLIKSTDGGKSWRRIKLIKGKGHTLNNPVLIVKNDVIHMLYLRDYKTLYHLTSSDEGENWSEEKEITYALEAAKYTTAAVGPGHGIVNSKGELVVPVWLAYNPDNEKAHLPSDVYSLYSKDDGATWHLGESVDNGILYNPNESAMALLSDGKILISMRNCDPRRERCFAVSDTGYSDWKNLHFDARFPDPMCMGSMTNGNGVICHINCCSKQLRQHLRLKYSSDDFKTIYEKEITGCGGYSDICVIGNTVYILYEETICFKDPKKDKEIWDINLCFTTAEIDFQDKNLLSFDV